MKKQTDSQPLAGLRLVTVRDVTLATGLCRDTLLSLATAGQFPKPLKAGKKIVWREAEVLAWANSLPPAA